MNRIFKNGGDKFLITDKYDLLFYLEIPFIDTEIYQNGLFDIVINNSNTDYVFPINAINTPSGSIDEVIEIFRSWINEYIQSDLATSTNQETQISYDDKISDDLDVIKVIDFSTSSKQDDIITAINNISGGSSIPDYTYSPQGALLTNERKTLFQLRFTQDLQPNLYSIVKLTNANIALNSSTSAARHSITSGTSRYAIGQTWQRIPYYNGNPQFIDMTFQDFDVETDIVKRLGTYTSTTTAPYNSDFDGIFLESDGITDLTHKIVISNASSGDVYTILRDDWDDPLDGTGSSGINYDFDNFTLFSYDYLWLGGTAIRFYINYGGSKILFHTFQHSGLYKNTIFSTPNLPVRSEIRNNTTGGTGQFDFICTGISTSSTSDLGQESAFYIPVLNMSTASTEYLLAAWKIQSGKENTVVLIDTIDITSITNDSFILLLKQGATASTTLTYTNIADSAISYSLGDGIITTSSGYLVKTFTLNQTGSIADTINNLIKIGTGINNSKNVFTLSAIPVSNNSSIIGGINFIEK